MALLHSWTEPGSETTAPPAPSPKQMLGVMKDLLSEVPGPHPHQAAGQAALGRWGELASQGHGKIRDQAAPTPSADRTAPREESSPFV